MNALIAQAAATSSKETFLAAGVVLTAMIGLLNLGYAFRNNRRSSYVASVTSTRLKWIGEVRDHLSRFVALVHECVAFPPSSPIERQKLLAQIEQHRMLLLLQLAPSEAFLDSDFQKEIESLYAGFPSINTSEIDKRLKDLVECGQRFLWVEWRKVKAEALHGDPYDTVPKRLRVWWGRIGPKL